MIQVDKIGNSVDVVFGQYAVALDTERASYHSSEIKVIKLPEDRSCVRVYVGIENQTWMLTSDQNYAGDNCYIVEAVNGIVPTSNLHLYQLIAGLRD